MATGNGRPRYRVLYPPDLQDQFQRWADRAVEVGRLAAYGAFLMQMNEQLVLDPMGWADSIRRPPARPGLHHCWRFNLLVSVEYYVDRVARTVRVTRAVLPPGSPLADPGA